MSLYQVVKRDGTVVSFDIKKISDAIAKASEAEREVDREIDQVNRFLDFFCGEADLEVYFYPDLLYELEERRREIRRHRKNAVRNLNAILRNAWRHRNEGSSRSNTSAVSDKMLLTIPTPPTFAEIGRAHV